MNFQTSGLICTLPLPQSQKHALPKFFRSLEDGCTSFPPARNVSDRHTKLLGDLKKPGGALIVYALTDVLENLSLGQQGPLASFGSSPGEFGSCQLAMIRLLPRNCRDDLAYV